MHGSPSTSQRGPRRTHGIMARLMRLAAGVLVVTLVVAAFTAVASESNGAPFECIYDTVQSEVFVASAGEPAAPLGISPVGVPYVEMQESPAAVAMLAGSSAPDVTRTVAWGDFRISTSTEDLTTMGYYCATVGQNVNNHRGVTATCTADDILTDAKRDTLVNYLIPQAIQMHTDRLQVKRVKGTWQVTGMTRPVCSNFLVPSSHITYGVSRADFVLYIASVPSSANVAAWATFCQVFSDDQPAVGVLNVPAAFIKGNNDAQLIHAIAHQIGHAIGFSDAYFSLIPTSAQVTGIRGKTYAAPVMNSANVVAKTREHYGCTTATYMELEDAGGVTAGSSHWKMRNAADELMAPLGGVGYYTALTMAAFEDLGFYKAIYGNAENMTWGNNAGCALLDDKCVIDGVSQFPSMFCAAEETAFRCTAGRLGLGSCEVSTYTTALPTYFQYFATATEGGVYGYMDYCPNIVEASVGSCTQNATAAVDNVTVFNVFSTSSRCFDGSFTPKEMAGATVSGYYGMCVAVRCDTQTLTYTIQVNGNSRFRTCTPGTNLTLSAVSDNFEAGGYITCPTYAEVCQSNLQAAADYQASVDAALAPRTVAVALAVLVLAMISA